MNRDGVDRAWTLPVAGALIAGLVAAQGAIVALSPALVGRRHTTFEEVIPLIALLAIPAAIGLAAGMLAWYSRVRLSPTVLVLIAAGGLAMRLVWFGATPPMEDDFYRYLWDGAVTAAGLDPYAVSPADVRAGTVADPILAALARTGADVLARVNFPDLRTIYPGTAQGVFALAHGIVPFDLDALRAVFLAADVAAAAVLLALAARLGQPPLVAALYWLNPMVVYAGVGLAHVDIVMVPAILAALWCAIAARPVWAGVLLGLAAGIKLWPILLAPLFVRPTAARSPVHALAALAVCGLVTAVLVAPLALSTLAPKSGLTAYAATWHVNNAPFAWASYGVTLLLGDADTVHRGLRAAVALAAVVVALAVAVPRIERAADLAWRALVVAAAVFYLSPAQFPWYALWFFGLAALVPSFPLLAASATLAAYYSFGPTFPYAAAFLHSAPVWAWLAYGGLTSRRRPAAPTTSPA